MSRFPKVPGAGAKAIINPVYWSRMQIQNQRYLSKRQQSIDKFNERWKRLGSIRDEILKKFIDGLSVNEKEYEKLSSLVENMNNLNDIINQNIDNATNADLSKYATSIKKVAIFSIRLCKKYSFYSDIEKVDYNSKDKLVLINEEEFYYLG